LRVSEIGYLPQQTAIQRNFPASILEVVMSGTLNGMGMCPFYSKQEKKEALEKIELMGLTGLEKRCYQDLSGGQQQRVLLARALCATSRMILLDEPVAGLDPVVTADLYELINRINTELGITVVMVSHDINAALKYSSHMLHLSHTQLYFGKTADYVGSDAAILLGERGMA
ncbi:MAG: ATP-binding cassette domain-containing protein, partial [Lachnospiraceae bacterium]|nr:ATP-binding cassette domain-containing protein [Lachnospiraceae bacterium]